MKSDGLTSEGRPLPQVTVSDINRIELQLGVEFDSARTTLLLSNDSFDVRACPGSGKTTLLVAKLALLAEKWPYVRRGICVLSHTNVARLEIERKLSGTAVGQKLLSYPHFVGTIQSFVDEFFALPMLRSESKSVRLIDDEGCGDYCRRLLYAVPAYSKAKNFLSRKEKNTPDRTIRSLRYEGHELELGTAAGILPGRTSRSYQDLQRIKDKASASGFYRFDDMFALAERLLTKYPKVAEVVGQRFPAIFIDEMQDTSETQGRLLAIVFEASSCELRQRFGDDNQAIFESGQAKATTDVFPGANVQTISNSLRFGQNIARKAEALAPSQAQLVGDGPPRNMFSTTVEPEQMPLTVFLFDKMTIGKVLPSFGAILLESFPDEIIKSDQFHARAIGRVGKIGRAHV